LATLQKNFYKLRKNIIWQHCKNYNLAKLLTFYQKFKKNTKFGNIAKKFPQIKKKFHLATLRKFYQKWQLGNVANICW